MNKKQKYYLAKAIIKSLFDSKLINEFEYTTMIKKAINKYGDYESNVLDNITLKSDIYSKEDK